jgi:endonuclease-3 related protein
MMRIFKNYSIVKILRGNFASKKPENMFLQSSPMKNKILELYKSLLKKYGFQGWWPLLDCDGCNPTKTGCVKGYHPKDYSYPKNEGQKFEICVGAILTQSIGWTSVEKALMNLKKINALTPLSLKKLNILKLKKAIKSAGYFNQKAKKLKLFADFFIVLNGRTPSREELLDVWGIGPETADSILLYAYKIPSFVIDAYTKRLMLSLGYKEKTYDELKTLFEKNLKKDYKLYQEFHALIVENGKNYTAKLSNPVMRLAKGPL